MWWTEHDTPLGRVVLLAREDGALTALRFAERFETPAEWRRQDAPFSEAKRQLDAYFDGRLRRFDLPLAPEGTAFQQRCWQVLTEIPFGETISYGEQARRVGRPGAARAVGQANGANPLPVIIPCHRVVATNGGLGGYTGGLHIKRFLLALEGALPAAARNGQKA